MREPDHPAKIRSNPSGREDRLRAHSPALVPQAWPSVPQPQVTFAIAFSDRKRFAANQAERTSAHDLLSSHIIPALSTRSARVLEPLGPAGSLHSGIGSS